MDLGLPLWYLEKYPPLGKVKTKTQMLIIINNEKILLSFLKGVISCYKIKIFLYINLLSKEEYSDTVNK